MEQRPVTSQICRIATGAALFSGTAVATGAALFSGTAVATGAALFSGTAVASGAALFNGTAVGVDQLCSNWRNSVLWNSCWCSSALQYSYWCSSPLSRFSLFSSDCLKQNKHEVFCRTEKIKAFGKHGDTLVDSKQYCSVSIKTVLYRMPFFFIDPGLV